MRYTIQAWNIYWRTQSEKRLRPLRSVIQNFNKEANITTHIGRVMTNIARVPYFGSKDLI